MVETAEITAEIVYPELAGAWGHHGKYGPLPEPFFLADSVTNVLHISVWHESMRTFQIVGFTQLARPSSSPPRREWVRLAELQAFAEREGASPVKKPVRATFGMGCTVEGL